MSDELTESQLAELKALLEKAEQDVAQGLSASSADAKPVDLGLSIGRLSRVDALQQQHMAMARRQRVEVQLQQVRAAVSRMKIGTYGACIKCGEPIGFARLKARPETPVCRDCQSGGGG
jgi:DnaK suppressor protein